MNELLLWMSAKCAGSIQAFRAKAAELCTPTATQSARRAPEWNMAKLGHAEFQPASGSDGWRVAPPVLAADGFETPSRAILCGARTPSLLSRLVSAAGANHTRMAVQAGGPDIIEVSPGAPPLLAEVASAAGIALQWNAPLALLSCCRPPRQELLKPVDMPVGGWAVSRFSKTSLSWVSSSVQSAIEARSGLFRFKSEYETQHILIEGGQPFACDVASGKYRVLRRRHRALAYLSEDKVLKVRATCRPPLLIERALIVSSGCLPTFDDGFLLYRNVERTAAVVAAGLLGQRLN